MTTNGIAAIEKLEIPSAKTIHEDRTWCIIADASGRMFFGRAMWSVLVNGDRSVELSDAYEYVLQVGQGARGWQCMRAMMPLHFMGSAKTVRVWNPASWVECWTLSLEDCKMLGELIAGAEQIRASMRTQVGPDRIVVPGEQRS